MLTSETKRRIDSCRDILVGKLPLPTDQVELITLALIYKFMDDLDEESVAMGGKRSFFTGALAPYRWSELMRQTVSADERMARFADGLELLGGAKKLRDEQKQADVDVAAHLPPLFRDIFRNAFLKFRDGRILTLFLTELGGFTYSHSEELGNAFEYILQCMGAQGDNGQFRTPRHIIDFIVACLDPQPTDRILDPACSATTSGRLDATKFKYLDEDIPQNAPCRCRRGDIYLQRGNTAELVGTAALFDIDEPDFIYPDLMIRVRADEAKILTKFLLHTLQSGSVRDFLMSQAGGAAGSMPKINQGIVERVPIPLPPLPEQTRIVAELDAEAARIEAVRGLIPAFEAKIQRVLSRVWGTEPA